MIHVAYAVHDASGGYSKFAGVSIASLLHETKENVTIHLLGDKTLSRENRERFRELVAAAGQTICFYDMEERQAKELAEIHRKLPGLTTSRFSPASVYRLLAAAVLPPEVHRLIYLDSDTVLHLDIAELWAEPLRGSVLGAVPEVALTYGMPAPQPLVEAGLVDRERYFNSGVLLLDLDRLREIPELAVAGIEVLREHPDCFCYDQDILNVVFADSYQPLAVRYDAFVVTERRLGHPLADCLYHYAGRALDFFLPEDPFNRLFLQYYLRSPWWEEAAFERLFAGVTRAYEGWRAHSRKVFSETAGRRRILFGAEARREELLGLLAPAGGASFQVAIDAQGQLFVSRILDTVKKRKGELFVFCLPAAAYEALRPYLESAGLAEDRDFLDAGQCLPRGAGGWELSSGEFFAAL